MTTPLLTAIVLAGGRSSRMGQDKALLLINGIPLLQYVCHVAGACASSVTVVSPWPDRYRTIVPTDCHLLAETLLPNETNFDSHSPLMGFYQGLKHVATDWVLLLACDMPYLKTEVLQEGVARLPLISPEAIALLPSDQQGWHPLCGFYRRTALDSLEAFIEVGGRSFQRWLDSQTVERWEPSDRDILFNCNTPGDWERALNRSA